MRIVYNVRGKHANKAKFFAESALRYGHKVAPLTKRTKDVGDVVVSYGNFIPRVSKDQIFINIHAGYLGRPTYHRISVGNYHPGEYIMDVDYPSDRLDIHNIKTEPWRKTGSKILVCTVSKFNMELFGLEEKTEIANTIKAIRSHTDKEIVMRDRKERWEFPLSDLFDDTWAVVTWSSNCAVEALIAGIPCFLRAGAAASPMCLSDLSRLENPYYPDNRQQWLQNLAYHQFHVTEIKNGTAWDMIMRSQMPRGVVIR